MHFHTVKGNTKNCFVSIAILCLRRKLRRQTMNLTQILPGCEQPTDAKRLNVSPINKLLASKKFLLYNKRTIFHLEVSIFCFKNSFKKKKYNTFLIFLIFSFLISDYFQLLFFIAFKNIVIILLSTLTFLWPGNISLIVNRSFQLENLINIFFKNANYIYLHTNHNPLKRCRQCVFYSHSRLYG